MKRKVVSEKKAFRCIRVREYSSKNFKKKRASPERGASYFVNSLEPIHTSTYTLPFKHKKKDNAEIEARSNTIRSIGE